jgi:hypothetical protein
MWNKPYGMKEGFLIGGALILTGLLLQLSIGSVDWDAFHWPVNGIVWAAFLALIAVFYLLRNKAHCLLFISTYKAAIPALVYVVALTIVMGLIRQDEQGTWLHHMLSFWPFVLVYVYSSLILGLVILRQLTTWAATKFSIRHFPISLLSHLGLFLAMTAGTLSTADIQRVKMITVKDSPEWRALTADQHIVEMPFTIKLKQFHMETYESGKPKRFASDIHILTQSGQHIDATIDVNKPIEVDGWKIYQYGYDTQMGAMSQTSILELISDPWLPLVYAGIYMLLGGAVCFMLLSIPWTGAWRQAKKHPKGALAITLLIGSAFFCVHHFMPILHSDTLVPALQSPWFRPHIIAYMLAYTLMASATIMAIYKLITHNTSLTSIDIIVYVGLSLITFGMLFGALWAKEAWGHYWSWDPKETWAAITWFSYLIYIHYRQLPTHKPKIALWILIISFILLQMCWWGIKFLPSAQETSVHVYSA